MGESLIERRRVQDEGLRVVNCFLSGTSPALFDSLTKKKNTLDFSRVWVLFQALVLENDITCHGGKKSLCETNDTNTDDYPNA